MPECVSCGKEIAAGRLFCDQCYKSMKGKLGPSKKRDPESKIPVGEARAGVATRPSGLPPEQPGQNPAGTLTPASNKKIVTLKRGIDKPSGGKETGVKKKFSITISLSERAYRTFGHLKSGSRRKTKDGAQVSDSTMPDNTKRRRLGKAGPHGRARLKAVEVAKRKSGETQGWLWTLVGYRERPMDNLDWYAAAIGTMTAVLILALSFLGWVSVKSAAEGGAANTQVSVKGLDFGLLFYILIAVVAFCWGYMAATLALKRPLLKIDFGIVMLPGGLICIAIIFVAMGARNNLLEIALRVMRAAGKDIRDPNALFEMQTLWPAYLMVLMGAAMSLAGLMRLSSRKEADGQSKNSTSGI